MICVTLAGEIRSRLAISRATSRTSCLRRTQDCARVARASLAFRFQRATPESRDRTLRYKNSSARSRYPGQCDSTNRSKGEPTNSSSRGTHLPWTHNSSVIVPSHFGVVL